MNTKKCSKCKKELNLLEFYSNGDYFRSNCKSCHKKNTKKWANENIEKSRSIKTKWRKNNLQYHKEWYKNNPEKAKRIYLKSNSKNAEYRKQNYKDRGLQLKSKRIWNGTNTEYNLNDFLNNKGVVYFIGDTNGIYVKIGITSNIFSLSHRFRSIQGCNPMPLKLLGFIQTNNARKLEKQLHQQFKTHNRIGEWHILAPEINRYIKENCMHIELANTMIGETYLSLPSLLADDLGY